MFTAQSGVRYTLRRVGFVKEGLLTLNSTRKESEEVQLSSLLVEIVCL